MAHWLAKSEPHVYAWDTFVAEGRTFWNGVRNSEARNNMRAMKLGDRVAWYHSNDGKEVVGMAEVVCEAYPDPTAEGDPRWVCVDLAPVGPFPKAVTLAQFKADPILCETKLVKQGRLSVTPLSPEQFARLCELGGYGG